MHLKRGIGPEKTGRAGAWWLGLVALALSWGCEGDTGRSVNAPCETNTDCASEICYVGICYSPDPKDDGAPCEGHGECRSFNCKEGTCERGEQPLGQRCLFGPQCASEVCKSEVCSLPTWWNNTWRWRHKLTFDNSAGGEHLDDFPVLITLTGARVDYSRTELAGRDLRFLDPDGAVLAHELESWNSTGTSRIWVRVPRIDRKTSSDHIWLYLGNASATDAQKAAAVWQSPYRGVWHMNQAPAGTAPQVLDSTANKNHGTSHGSMATTDLVAGPIGKAIYFDGNDYLNIGTHKSLDMGAGDITVMAWVNIQKPDYYDGTILAKGGAFTGGKRYSLAFSRQFDGPAGAVKFELDDNKARVGVSTAKAYHDEKWHHMVGVRHGGSLYIYANGAQEQFRAATITTESIDSPMLGSIGAVYDMESKGMNEYYKGKIDEVRIIGAARSPAWIAAQYRSMTDAFITYGAAEAVQ